jgi:hypothetical protein
MVPKRRTAGPATTWITFAGLNLGQRPRRTGTRRRHLHLCSLMLSTGVLGGCSVFEDQAVVELSVASRGNGLRGASGRTFAVS